jgi:hypothetical protein
MVHRDKQGLVRICTTRIFGSMDQTLLQDTQTYDFRAEYHQRHQAALAELCMWGANSFHVVE